MHLRDLEGDLQTNTDTPLFFAVPGDGSLRIGSLISVSGDNESAVYVVELCTDGAGEVAFQIDDANSHASNVLCVELP